MDNKIILVVGATGTQGGSVIKHLLKQNWKVQGLTRNPESEKAKILASQGVEILQGDLDNQEELEKLFQDVYGVFSVQNTWTAGVENETAQGINVARAAKAAGVQHLVYTSVGGAENLTGIPHFDSKHQIEVEIKKLNLPFTIVRPAFFFENFFFLPGMKEGFAKGNVAMGQMPDKPLQMIAVDDIGGIVASIFRNPDKFMNQGIEISSDEVIVPEVLNKLAGKLGKTVEYSYVPFEQLKQIAGDDTALMFKWFNEKGYYANFTNVKKIYPQLQSFDKWLEQAPVQLLQ